MTVIIMTGGSTVASMAIIAPATEPILNPVSIAALTAIAPGEDCAIAARSIISFSSSHLRSSTNLRRISGIMTNPPPKVNALI